MGHARRVSGEENAPGRGDRVRTRRIGAAALAAAAAGVLVLVVSAAAGLVSGGGAEIDTPVGTDYAAVRASAYGGAFVGRRTACGEILTEGSRIVAHRTLACGTPLDLRLDGTTVSVTVGDRGPFEAGRELDLAPAVWSEFGYASIAAFGVRPVDVRLAG